MRAVHRHAVAVALGAACGCSALTSVDGLVGTSPPAIDAASSDAGSETTPALDASLELDAATGECPGSAGPVAKRIRLDSGSFCIDTTEVTNAHYAGFLDAAASLDAQAAVCANNGSYDPSAGWPFPKGAENYPVGAIDWCDALAFCTWAGKRLCTYRVDGAERHTEWYVACTRNETQRFPYGDQVDTKACNSAPLGLGDSVAVASLPGCEGGYQGVFDMVGNVSEWIDDCDDAGCAHRGGASADGKTADGGINPAGMECASTGQIGRLSKYRSVGFRCCSD